MAVVNNLTEMMRYRINGITLGQVQLPKGQGKIKSQLCIMQMANMARHGKDHFGSGGVPDTDPKTSGVLRMGFIEINDALGEGPRQRLKEYAPRIARDEFSFSVDSLRQKVRDRSLNETGMNLNELARSDLRAALRVIDEMLAIK